MSRNRRTLELKRGYLFAIVLVSMLAGAGCYALLPEWLFPHGRTLVYANVEFSYRCGSDAIVTSEVGNTITWLGENETSDRFSVNATYVATGWISLGNASDNIWTRTKLNIAEFSRDQGAVVTPNLPYGNPSHSAYTVFLSKTFVAHTTINATGLQWSGTGDSDNNLFAVAYLQGGTQLLWNIGDQLNVTWTISFSTTFA